MRRVTYLLDSPNPGGAEAYVAQLVRGLRHEQQTTVVATRPVPAPVTAAAGAGLVQVAPIGTDDRRLPELQDVLAATRPDVVHANLIDPASNRLLLQAAAATGAATVATCHMIGRTPDADRLRSIYASVDAVIAVSHAIAALLAERLDVTPARRHVIHPGVIALEARRTATQGRRRQRRIGAVGRLTGQKGFDLLIQATARLVADGHDVEVEVAGDGRDRAALESAAAGLPVRFLGHRDDIASFLGSLDVFCLPSRAEGLPYSLLEAMSAGLPCVATDVGDIRRAVGRAVTVVPSEDIAGLAHALSRLLDDAAARATLGARAGALVRRQLTLDRMLRETAAVYGVLTRVVRRHHVTSR